MGRSSGQRPLRQLRLLMAFVGAVTTVFATGVDAGAEPLGPTIVNDADDVPKRLDIRSVAVETVAEGRTRVVLVFWNGIPPQFLSERGALVKPLGYAVRFWPGRRGQLRVTWGDPASSCCLTHRARHPDPFTYTTVLPLDRVMPPPTDVHGSTTRRLACTGGSRCGISGGREVDTTRMAAL
jgi:hypothetical protein